MGERGPRPPLPAFLSRVPQIAWLGLRSVFWRRSRAAFTLLALTFSATASLAIQTTTYSVDIFISRLFEQYGSDLFVFTNRPQPADQIRAELLSTSNVATVERFENTSAKSRWGTVILTGIEDDPTLYRRDVLRGRWFRPGEMGVILVNEQLASKAGLKVGDGLPLSLGAKAETFLVIGIVHDLNGSLGTIGVALTPIGQLYEFEDRPAGLASGFMIATVASVIPALSAARLGWRKHSATSEARWALSRARSPEAGNPFRLASTETLLRWHGFCRRRS